jgi:hypothetical protein|tara:strand:+ start:116 stop:508 length:393 start_codon:yes stop_codon:yes gene_type:complete
MALRLTRSVDSVLYGGENLNPEDLEGSFEHRLWVRRVRDHRGIQDALVNVTSKLGVSEYLMKVGDEGILLGLDINITLVGITQFFMKGVPACNECGRFDLVNDRIVPQARMAINAPRKYELIRHDARKKR